MILTGNEIENEIKAANITISPYDKKQLNPNSYNLRLHNELLVYNTLGDRSSQYEHSPLDMRKDTPTVRLIIPESGYLLQPNQLYLGMTVEKTHTDYYVPILSGRSSTGRLGINIHATAGYGDIGFNGYWTLEIFVIHPIVIYPNVEICQIYFNTIQGKVSLYKGKYQNNSGIQSSEIWKELNFRISKSSKIIGRGL